jgi:hypothetical protein
MPLEDGRYPLNQPKSACFATEGSRKMGVGAMHLRDMQDTGEGFTTPHQAATLFPENLS